MLALSDCDFLYIFWSLAWVHLYILNVLLVIMKTPKVLQTLKTLKKISNKIIALVQGRKLFVHWQHLVFLRWFSGLFEAVVSLTQFWLNFLLRLIWALFDQVESGVTYYYYYAVLGRINGVKKQCSRAFLFCRISKIGCNLQKSSSGFVFEVAATMFFKKYTAHFKFTVWY